MESYYFITVPIGNFQDISYRAADALKNASIIICERPKATRALLKFLNIDFYEGAARENEKSTLLFPLTRKSSEHQIDYLKELLMQNNSSAIAQVSDSGSPFFEDPGYRLLSFINKNARHIFRIGGTTSLSVFMMYFPERIKKFFFYGFLPRNTGEREKELRGLLKMNLPLVFLETPYRTNKILKELKYLFSDWQILLGLDLTMESEKIICTRLSQLKSTNLGKREFIALLYK
ncbi:SAM-dependent methyltransferase [Candidatus Riflebacteria bacterium]